MTIQYLQIEKRKLAVVDLKEAKDLLDYLEDLEDSLEAFRRTDKRGKRYSGEEIRKEFLQNRIREARLRHGLTQEDLAEKLDVTQAFVSKLENSDYRPSLESLKKVSAALKVEVEDLI